MSLHIDQDDSYRRFSALSDVGDLSELRTAYLGTPGPLDTADPAHPWTESARITHLTGLPPTLRLTAEFDPLREGGERYAARLAPAGVPTRSWRVPGHLHGSLSITGTSETARAGQRHVIDFPRTRAHRTAANPPS